MTKRKTDSVSLALANALKGDLHLVLKSNPELFDFSALSIQDKITLTRYDIKEYGDIISKCPLSAADKVTLLINLDTKAAKKLFILTHDEVKSLSPTNYFYLLKVDFDRYISAEKFTELPRSQKSEIFLDNPEWLIKNNFEIKLTSEVMTSLAVRKPAFIEKNISDFSNRSLDSYFWIRMIKYNPKYGNIFLNNTKSTDNKTSIRSVVRAYPDLIKKLDGNILQNSKLTTKEWILLADSVINVHPRKFKDWEFSDEMKEIMRLDLTVEMLSGKSKLSTRFQRAMNGVLSETTEEDTNTA